MGNEVSGTSRTVYVYIVACKCKLAIYMNIHTRKHRHITLSVYIHLQYIYIYVMYSSSFHFAREVYMLRFVRKKTFTYVHLIIVFIAFAGVEKARWGSLCYTYLRFVGCGQSYASVCGGNAVKSEMKMQFNAYNYIQEM